MENLPFQYLRMNRAPAFHLCEAGFRWNANPLMDYDLWCVQAGRGTMHLNHRDYELHAGATFLIRPGQAPRVRHTTGPRLRVFAAHFDILDGAGRATRDPGCEKMLAGRVDVRDTVLLDRLAHACFDAYASDGPRHELSTLWLRQMLLQMWHERSNPAPSPIESRIRGIVNAIHEDPAYKWTVGDMARRAHLSRSQFTRRFEAATRAPPVRYVLETRLRRAVDLIKDTDLRIGEIASTLGYRDVYFFSRQFRKFMGRPPSALRSGNRDRETGGRVRKA